MTERWIHVTARLRGAPRIDDPEVTPVPDDPTIAELARLVVADERRTVIAGGEPSLRPDLPDVVAALPSAVLRTDGLALVSPAAVRSLRDAGLGSVRVLLHAAQPAAHDWLVGTPGAAKRAMRSLQLAADAGLRTEIEAVVTRSNAPVLSQLVELAERLRVRAVHVRRVLHRGPATRETFGVAFGLLEDPLEAALVAASRGRIVLAVHGFPRCALPRLGPVLRSPGEVAHTFVSSPAWVDVAAAHAVPSGALCDACPDRAGSGSTCPGFPVEQVRPDPRSAVTGTPTGSNER